MRPPSCLGETGLLIADASTIINLNATGCAKDILRALAFKIAFVDVVQGEIEAGRERGRRDAALTQELVDQELVDVVRMGESALECFEQLVVGPAAETLDDGEAATLAAALELGGIAILDDRKALRISAARYPTLANASTLDIFGHPRVVACLTDNDLANAVFAALRDARMRVFGDHVPWVLELIGQERASSCPSLPRAVRFQITDSQKN